MLSPDVTLLTAARYLEPRPDDWYISQIHLEENLLADGLRELGLTVARADWAQTGFAWEETRCAVFRSTWDYFDRFAEFMTWLRETASRTQLVNSSPLLLWNVDKHYLADLAAAGVEIVPTHFVEAGEEQSLVQIAAERGWEEIVFKPAVSGAARLTFRAAAGDLPELEKTFARCVAVEAMMVQPFQPEVLTHGEVSLIVIDGRFTHALRKTPRPGDFRVQDDHGGTVHPHTAAPEEIAFAEKAVAACPELPVYARVDLVNTPGGCRLMELELVEPELFFRFSPPAAKALARAIAARLALRPLAP